MDDNVRDLIFQAIDQTISQEDFQRLQDAIELDIDVRSEYLRAVGVCESLGDIAVESSDEPTHVITSIRDSSSDSIHRKSWRFSTAQLAIAASVLILIGGTTFWLGRTNVTQLPEQMAAIENQADEPDELQLAGHATLRRAVDLIWSDGTTGRREGDVLPNGTLAFDGGVVEIDFFCGATLIVEGPASLDIESDWSVRVGQGRLRANVPPAARGFVVKAAGSEIVDLGTEFALQVGPDNARVEVIDGEVELRGGKHNGKHLVTGQGQSLKGTQNNDNTFDGLITVTALHRRREDAEAQRFAQWKQYSRQLRSDERLIAYYPIAETQSGRVVSNASSSGSREDCLLIGPVEQTSGRFGPESAGLQFNRPGARARTRIDGDFKALAFACWVRIDSLEHRYNALFMGDGYENGEPHWQIRDDGRLMFSVMVDDTPGSGEGPAPDARLHHIYFTKPFWDVSKSGQWFHLAAIYDPIGRRAVQYINGEQFSSEEITDKFHVPTLRIGAAEIGNWGQPFRKTPGFAVRNLNGTIDELTIFNAALTSEDIHDLYEKGKPLGY